MFSDGELVSDKKLLLDEIVEINTPNNNFGILFFIYSIFTLSFILMFAFPKIFIQQQIYYKSRDIAKLEAEFDILKEENKLIQSSVEIIKFKNQILDTLF